jgi:hypothetical protein
MTIFGLGEEMKRRIEPLMMALIGAAGGEEIKYDTPAKALRNVQGMLDKHTKSCEAAGYNGFRRDGRRGGRAF